MGMKMRHDYVVFITIFVAFSLVFSSIAFYMTSARLDQPYMEFGIYSPSGLNRYIPNNLTLTTGQNNNWTLHINNHMARVELVMITVRIGNLTTQSPNSTVPAVTLPTIDRYQRFVNDGSSVSVKFSWTVTSLNQTGGLVYPSLQINGQLPVPSSPIGAVQGRNFKLIFELWTFDTASSSFQYGYAGQFSRVGTWLQVWFNVSP
jgi:uncharacterized membrane protein